MDYLYLLQLLKPRVLHDELNQDNIFIVQSKKPCIFIKECVNIILEDELKPAPQRFWDNSQSQ